MTTSKLKITILGLHYAPEPTGNAPYTSSLAAGLSACGHQVTVLTGYPHYPEWKVSSGYKGWTRKETIDGVKVTRLRHHVPAKPNGLSRLHMELSFGLRLIFARWNNPDVILLVTPALFSTALALFRAKLLVRRPVLVWVQDLYSRGIEETGGSSGTTVRLAAFAEGLTLRQANAVVAIHRRFKRYLVDGLRVPEEGISVIRNWTHLPSAAPVDVHAVRQKLGWTDSDIVALHSGNMGKKQGLANVVRAARLAEESGSRVKFVLMGDGNQRKDLMSAAEGLQRIQFVDSLPMSDFQAALEAADVLLVNELPGVRDMSVPSKLTSYFTSGRPVVAATDEGSVTAEEIDAAGAGVRVDAGDPSALLAAVEALGNDSLLSVQLGDSGKRFREETLSESAALDRYDDLITSLALSRGR